MCNFCVIFFSGNFNVWDFEIKAEDFLKFSDLNVGWRHLLAAEVSRHRDYPYKSELPYGFILGKATYLSDKAPTK